jgi:putative ABC transport system substrate-binding protein
MEKQLIFDEGERSPFGGVGPPTYSSEHTQIAKQVTSTIPIVFALAADPVGSGLVANLARPGGNITGLSAQNVDLTGKRFELLREIVPGLRRLAVLFNGNNPTATIEIDIVRTAASPLGIEVSPSAILDAEDIAPAIARIAKQADALFVVGEPLTFTHRTRINTLALAARLPTNYPTRGYVEVGGLMSYGPNFPGFVSAGRRLRPQNPARREAWRSARGAAHEVRSRH